MSHVSVTKVTFDDLDRVKVKHIFLEKGLGEMNIRCYHQGGYSYPGTW